jgi:hypothetical protein
LARPERSSFINDAPEFIKREFPASLRVRGGNSQPAMEAVVVASVGQIETTFKREAKIESSFLHETVTTMARAICPSERYRNNAK